MTLVINCCSPKEERSLSLNGHWHLFNLDEKSDKVYYNLEMEDDTTGHFSGISFLITSDFRYKKSEKKIKDFKKAIFFVDGYYEQFDYRLKNDTLYLINDDNQQLEFYAVKNTACDPVKDLFSINNTELILTTIDQSGSITYKKDGIIYAEVLFGKNKYTGKPELEIERGLLSKNQSLPILIEKFKVKIPSTKKLGAILNVDQNVDKKEVDKLVEVLKSHNFKDFLERKITEERELVLISIY